LYGERVPVLIKGQSRNGKVKTEEKLEGDGKWEDRSGLGSFRDRKKKELSHKKKEKRGRGEGGKEEQPPKVNGDGHQKGTI